MPLFKSTFLTHRVKIPRSYERQSCGSQVIGNVIIMENAENLIPVTFSTAFFLPGQMFLVSLLKNTWTIIQAHHGHCEVVLAQVLVEGKNRNRKTFTLNKTCLLAS